MNHVLANKIETITDSLDLLAQAGTKYMTLKLTMTWFEHFMFVLGEHHFSVGTYQHGGRFLQLQLAARWKNKPMYIIINTDEVPEGVPQGVKEGYMRSWVCPDCGDLDTAYGATEEVVFLAAVMFGGLDPFEVTS